MSFYTRHEHIQYTALLYLWERRSDNDIIVCVCVCMWSICRCVCTCVCTHVHVHVYTCVCACVYMCMGGSVVAVWCSGCVLGSGPEVLSSSPTQATFTSSFSSASYQPHQSTQLWLGTWHLLGCNSRPFLRKQQWSRWDFGCPHHLLWGKACSPASS